MLSDYIKELLEKKIEEPHILYKNKEYSSKLDELNKNRRNKNHNKVEEIEAELQDISSKIYYIEGFKDAVKLCKELIFLDIDYPVEK